MGEFVETWKGIAALVGRSERWARYMTARAVRPLPVFKMGGIVRLNHADLEAWIDEERRVDAAEKAARACALHEAVEGAIAANEDAEVDASGAPAAPATRKLENQPKPKAPRPPREPKPKEPSRAAIEVAARRQRAREVIDAAVARGELAAPEALS